MLKRNLTSELVKKFDEAISKILDYKNEKKFDEALTVIDDTFKEIFRLSSKFFNSFSDENLIDMIKTDGTINADKCIMMARLLEEEGDIFELQKNFDEAFYMNLKSLNLFLEAYLNKDDNCDLQKHFSSIDIILHKLSEYKLPMLLQSKLMEYYIRSNRYDKAEDVLYEILEAENFNEDSLKLGINFYENLLSMNDENLEEGNLPREEINESLPVLKKRLIAYQ